MEAPTIDQSNIDREEALTRSQEAPPVGHVIRGYHLTELLGKGTFGEVWAGTSQRTGMEVALKIFTQTVGVDWSFMRQEVDRLGKVAEHPHVVTLLDADLNHSPPFFCMRRYRGSLYQWRKEHPEAAPAQILRWWKQIAEALQYTHSKGLLHCDIKPQNLLLDEEERALLSDFGQAAAGRGRGGSHLGSLGYMAPEQATQLEEGSTSPDVLWDIYGLGASIYYLLSKKLPRLSEAALHELGSVAQTAEKLSRYRRTLNEQPLVPIRKYCPQLKPELEALLHSCLEIDPRRRPQSAADLLQDFERCGQGLPLLCRRPWTPGYRARTFVRRYLAPLLVGALLLGAGGLAVGQRWTEHCRMQARGDFEHGLTRLQEGRTLAAAHWWARSLAVVPGQTAPSWLLREDPAHLQFYRKLPAALNQVGFSPDGNLLYASGENGSQVFDLRTSQPRGPRMGGPDPRPGRPGVAYQDLPPAGLLLGSNILLTLTSRTELWDLASGQAVSATLPAALQAVASADGSQAVLVTESGLVRVHFAPGEPGKVTQEKLPELPERVTRVALQADGKQIAVGDGAGGIWLMPQKEKILDLGQPVDALGFSPDGQWLVASAEKSKFTLWDVKSAKPHTLDDGHYPVFGLSFSPVGQYVAFSCYNGATHLYNLENLGRPPLLMRHKWLTYNSTFSPDGKYLATFSMDGTARVYETRTGRAVSPFLEHSSPVKSVAFRPGPSLDGAMDVATACEDGSVRVFRLDMRNEPLALQRGARAFQAEYSPDGQHLAVVCEDLQDHGWIEIWSGARCERTIPLPASGHYLRWSPGGQELAAGTKNSVLVFSLQGGAPLYRLEHPLAVTSLEYGPGGQLLTSCADGQARLYENGQLLRSFDPPGAQDMYVAHFSRDGRQIVTASGRQVDVWDTSSGAHRGTGTHQGVVRQAVFAPDGGRVATASLDKTAQIWSLENGLHPLLSTPIRHELGLNDISFSPDGSMVATAAADGRAGLWYSATGLPVCAALRHDGPVWNIRFSPDGRVLSTCTKKGIGQIWGLNGLPLAAPIEHADFVYTACFRNDSRELTTVSADGTMQRRDLTPPEPLPVAALQRQIEKRTGMRITVELGSCLLHPIPPEEWAKL